MFSIGTYRFVYFFVYVFALKINPSTTYWHFWSVHLVRISSIWKISISILFVYVFAWKIHYDVLRCLTGQSYTNFQHLGNFAFYTFFICFRLQNKSYYDVLIFLISPSCVTFKHLKNFAFYTVCLRFCLRDKSLYNMLRCSIGQSCKNF